MVTLRFDNIFIQGTSAVGGPKEKAGPIGRYLDRDYKDLYCDSKTFEKGERQMVIDAIELVFMKSKMTKDSVDLAIGGDLNNQITASSYSMRNFDYSFIGIYGACSTSSLSMIIASIAINSGVAKNVLGFTSSNYGVAERQFRYPLEYGIQRKVTYTYTVTGAAAFIVGKKPTNIRIASATIGKIVDLGYKDINDMGIAMAPAAYDTIKTHLTELKIDANYYDLIVTGDLSKYGLEALKEMAKIDNFNLGNINDCGLIIFDSKKQNTFAGGSGAACSAVVTWGFLIEQMKNGIYNKILMVATGAMMSPVVFQQHESLVVTAHAVGIEVVK